jgi:integrase
MANRQPSTPIPVSGLDANQTLLEAGLAWIEFRRSRSTPKTIECQQGYVNRLVEHFGDIPLRDFHIGLVNEYQAQRSKKAGPSAINHELNLLGRLLKNADVWSPIAKHYQPLREPEWKAPKTFTVQEQDRIFKTLQGDPDCQLADIVFTITRNTTASGCELRQLRLRHLELEGEFPRVHIPREGTKNIVRPRVIPLNPEAVAAFRRALERASAKGAHYPEHFLFPLRVKRNLFDPRRPASKSWLRKQTVKLREATGIQHLRPHAFRHLAVTELLEKGAPESTVIAIAGWASRKMIETYSHTRMESKASAVALLGGSVTRARRKPVAIPLAAVESIQPSWGLGWTHTV